MDEPSTEQHHHAGSDDPSSVLVFRGSSDWQNDGDAVLRAHGFDVRGPIEDLCDAIRIVQNDRSLLSDIAVIQAIDAGPCGWMIPVYLYKEHGIPSVVISHSRKILDHITSAADKGVYGTLQYPFDEVTFLCTFRLAWSHFLLASEMQSRIDHLERTLDARRVVEKAKWRLVEIHGMTEPDAHSFLQTQARSQRRKIHEVASELLEKSTAEPVD